MAAVSPKMMLRPQIILLKEGTDTSQGRGQLLSNINACLAVVDTIRTTLGPRGMDKLIVDDKGKATISNDGATIMKLLDIVHPAAKSLVDIARAQDAQVGDGTTSVVLLAGELLKETKGFIEDGLSPRIIMQGYRAAAQMAVQKIESLSVSIKNADESFDGNFRGLLEKCAATSMNSKLIHNQKDFFKKLVVDAILTLDQADLNERLIGMKKIPGGALQDTMLVEGVAFKKTFSYAGFEQQPKKFENPSILCLNVELELKAERDNAEIRVERVADYQSIVEAEWTLFYNKLEKIVATGAKVVLSKLPIGDLATQYFADRDIFCAGRVPAEDLNRVVMATGGAIQSSVHDLINSKTGKVGEGILGSCGMFEERQVGSERYNFFTNCRSTRTCTFLLRGGSEQFISEVERSLHDALMIVKRAVQHQSIVGGGGAIEMALSKHLREFAKSISGKMQAVVMAFAKSLEIIPRQLADNAGLDSIQILNGLRKAHVKSGDAPCWMGVNVLQSSTEKLGSSTNIADMLEIFVWEPSAMKTNLISAAAEAACLIISIDETVKAPPPPEKEPNPMMRR